MANKLYQFRASDKIDKLLNDLKKDIGAESIADVIREAVIYFAFIIKEVKNKSKIYIVTSEDIKNNRQGKLLSFPFLDLLSTDES